jgi:hypothetical protein
MSNSTFYYLMQRCVSLLISEKNFQITNSNEAHVFVVTFLISEAIIHSFQNESSLELHGRQPNTQVNELIAPNF